MLSSTRKRKSFMNNNTNTEKRKMKLAFSNNIKLLHNCFGKMDESLTKFSHKDLESKGGSKAWVYKMEALKNTTITPTIFDAANAH